MEWIKHNTHPLYKYIDCYYQGLVYKKGEEKIYANILEYTMDNKKDWELELQIPDELSPTGKTTNVHCLSYDKLDFKKFEKDAKKLIKSLIK